jgi:hypothetical protein
VLSLLTGVPPAQHDVAPLTLALSSDELPSTLCSKMMTKLQAQWEHAVGWPPAVGAQDAAPTPTCTLRPAQQALQLLLPSQLLSAQFVTWVTRIMPHLLEPYESVDEQGRTVRRYVPWFAITLHSNKMINLLCDP